MNLNTHRVAAAATDIDENESSVSNLASQSGRQQQQQQQRQLIQINSHGSKGDRQEHESLSDGMGVISPTCQNLTRSSTRQSRPVTLHSTRSYVDGHGHYRQPDDEKKQMSNNNANGKNQDNEENSSDVVKDEFIVDWDGPDDPMNPKNMSTGKKWSVVVLLAFGSLCVTSASSVYTVTYTKMDVEFGNSRIVATLGLSLFVFGLGLAPMVLGPLSEFFGRRIIYVCGFIFFTIWLIPCAVAPNIQTVLVARFFDGLAGSAFLSVAGGTVGDMFTKETLQAPMLVYTASPFIGPGLGPVWGGALNYFLDWRWSYYVLLIWSGIMTVLIAAFVPETYMPVLLREKARRKRKVTGDDRWKAPIEMTDRSIAETVLRSLYRPFLLLFLDPMVFVLCLYSSVLLGILYLFFGAFNLVFSTVYGFNLWQVGLSFAGLATGMIFAILSDPFWHYFYLHLLDKRERLSGRRASEPEDRLPPAIFGAWFIVAGLFWFAWTTYPTIHWISAITATSLFGFGTILVYTGVFTFLVEAYPLYAASALSANSFARSSFAGAFPLFGVQMYNTLGFQWASTLLAILTLVLAPFPYVFYRYGKRLRAKSRFGSS